MPIYEYECTKCNHLTEAWQKFSDPPITKCELCNGKMKKLISQNTFHLKGSGWYVTDYASKNREGEQKKSETSTTDSTPKKEAKSASETEKPKTDGTSSADKKTKEK
jgi:putative FmdB family regulatory protein